jgi:thiamine pyrophosphokinase
MNKHMAGEIVQSGEIVTLLGAGAVTEAALSESLARGPLVVAADGGAETALAHGLNPAAVIGDFDSLSAATRRAIPKDRLHHIAEQDSTDFTKARTRIAAPLVLAVGFTGRRTDHELAVYSALVRIADRPTIVLAEEDICFALTKPLELQMPVGTRVSLFPMAELRCGSAGLRWATEGIVFSPWGRVGTSNESSAPQVRLEPEGPGMLVILPRAMLDVAIAALLVGAESRVFDDMPDTARTT